MRKFNVVVNGKAYAVEVEEVGAAQGAFTYVPVQAPVAEVQAPKAQPQPTPVAAAPVVEKAKKSTGPVEGETISAPMPGTIVNVKVSEGQSVKAGDVLLILEAMKMENEIVSPKAGVVNAIHVSKSDTVASGDSLITIG